VMRPLRVLWLVAVMGVSGCGTTRGGWPLWIYPMIPLLAAKDAMYDVLHPCARKMWPWLNDRPKCGEYYCPEDDPRTQAWRKADPCS